MKCKLIFDNATLGRIGFVGFGTLVVFQFALAWIELPLVRIKY